MQKMKFDIKNAINQQEKGYDKENPAHRSRNIR